ncbi:hypothetical protein [Roseateles sp. LYH14W]|uniref:Uncharacterized protein n=1 Tax=Pelomonas parva TaxID=3299032 RepID=A0ABW7F6D1_9BURK
MPRPSGVDLPYIAAAATLGALMTLAWRACSATHARRCGGRCARAPAALQDWEGEGGRPLPDEHEAGQAPVATRT